MKRYAVFFAVIALALASLACQTLTGGASDDSAVPSAGDGGDLQLPDEPQSPPGDSNGGSGGGADGFPMPEGAYEIQSVGDNVNFLVKMDVADALKFYRDAFTQRGYVEMGDATHLNEGLSFGATFEDPQSGNLVTVQGFYNIAPDGSMSDEIINVTIIPFGQ